jgi:hypothetical protein
LAEVADYDFAVDKVFGATEGDEGDCAHGANDCVLSRGVVTVGLRDCGLRTTDVGCGMWDVGRVWFRAFA